MITGCSNKEKELCESLNNSAEAEKTINIIYMKEKIYTVCNES